jgi:hypothetical protein
VLLLWPRLLMLRLMLPHPLMLPPHRQMLLLLLPCLACLAAS